MIRQKLLECWRETLLKKDMSVLIKLSMLTVSCRLKTNHVQNEPNSWNNSTFVGVGFSFGIALGGRGADSEFV